MALALRRGAGNAPPGGPFHHPPSGTGAAPLAAASLPGTSPPPLSPRPPLEKKWRHGSASATVSREPGTRNRPGHKGLHGDGRARLRPPSTGQRRGAGGRRLPRRRQDECAGKRASAPRTSTPPTPPRSNTAWKGYCLKVALEEGLPCWSRGKQSA